MSGEIEYIINCRNIGTTKCHRGSLKGALHVILFLKGIFRFFVFDSLSFKIYNEKLDFHF